MVSLVKQKIKFSHSANEAKENGRYVDVMNVAMAFVLNYISDKGFLKRYQKAKAVTWEDPITKAKPVEPRPASPKAKPFFKYNGPKARDAKSVKMSSEEVAVETEEEQSSATDSEQPP